MAIKIASRPVQSQKVLVNKLEYASIGGRASLKIRSLDALLLTI
jgi:hypothetical protein